MARSDGRRASRRSLRGLWLAAPLAGFVACADLVGADFDHAKPRPSGDAGATGPFQAAQFGSEIAIDGHGLAITAPLENVPVAEGSNGLVSHGGAVFYVNLDEPSASPVRIVAPNVSASDGVVPASVRPGGYDPNYPHDSMHLALGDGVLVVGVAAESSGSVLLSDDRSAPQAGAVYVYDRVALAAQPTYLKSPAPHGEDQFGQSVAVSGSRLAVGAPGEDQGATDSGAVYVYEQQGGRYSLAQRIQPNVILPGTYFGYSVALDGDLLIVGAVTDATGGTGVNPDPNAPSMFMGDGAAYVFRFGSDGWTQEAFLKSGVPGLYAFFGASVAVSNATVVVGAAGGVICPGEDGAPSRAIGTAYVFTKQGAGWVEGQCLKGASDVNQLFGFSVALAGDTLLIGAPWDSSGTAPDAGSASTQFAGGSHLYARDGLGEWHETAYLRAPDVEANDVFGYSVGITGNMIAVGAPYTAGGPHPQDPSTYKGAVYMFREDGPVSFAKRFLGD